MRRLHRTIIFSGLCIVALLAMLFWSWTPTDFSNLDCKLMQNGAWISGDWTSKPVEENAARQLAESAKTRQVKYLFPYISYLKADGSFSSSYQYADEFVGTIHKFNEDVQVLAWIGLPLVNHRFIGVQGWVNLADQNTRQRIAQFIVARMEQADFDGVHLNAETVQNNDPYFLNLLDEVRKSIGKDKIISIAGSHWFPEYINLLPFIKNLRWTSAYYQQVSMRADQIATMTYDSYMFHPALYRLWMREQVRGISSSVENSDVELLIGISVSQETTFSHQPNVENLANGLAGLCTGLSSKNVQGIAVYADWDFAPSDRQVWQAWKN